MKYLKKFEDIKVPSYMTNNIGYKNNMTSELEENLIELSGDYENSYDFIISNNLENEFLKIYGDYNKNEYDNIEDYIRDIGDDENVIIELLNNKYHVFYNDEEDIFNIIKKKSDKIVFDIKLSEERDKKDIIDIIEDSGIYSEMESRFKVIVDDKIVGGSSFLIYEDTYSFDMGIVDEYQGYGISKSLIENIINDAKSFNVKHINAQVVNYRLAKYLQKIGFSVYKDSGTIYASFDL